MDVNFVTLVTSIASENRIHVYVTFCSLNINLSFQKQLKIYTRWYNFPIQNHYFQEVPCFQQFSKRFSTIVVFIRMYKDHLRRKFFPEKRGCVSSPWVAIRPPGLRFVPIGCVSSQNKRGRNATSPDDENR